MEAEQIPPQNDNGESPISEQMGFDFDEAEVKGRAVELRKEHPGWIESYAMDVARIEIAAEKRRKKQQPQ